MHVLVLKIELSNFAHAHSECLLLGRNIWMKNNMEEKICYMKQTSKKGSGNTSNMEHIASQIITQAKK